MIDVSRNSLLYLIKFVITALKDIDICTAMRLAFDLCLIACISVTSGPLYLLFENFKPAHNHPVPDYIYSRPYVVRGQLFGYKSYKSF